MIQIPENVRVQINKLVPSSIVNDIVCFVFYDNHPRDLKKLDITICTNNGEIKEYFQREQISSTKIIGNPIKIRIIRNSHCELFYLVVVLNGLIILSTKEELHVKRYFHNVDNYELDDSVCRGKAYLKIIRKDDAIPLFFDDNFESVEYKDIASSVSSAKEESLPIVTQLTRKLTEAQYCVKYNEKSYQNLSQLRKVTTLTVLEDIRPNLEDSVFSKDTNINGSLILKTCIPWVKICNNKIVIVLFAQNKYGVTITNVQILLHGTTRPTMVYMTKLFLKISTSPFWSEKHVQRIKPEQEVAIVSIIDLKEIKHNITSRIDFNGIILFNKNNKEYILPFDKVYISAKDAMEEEFDVLYSKEIDEQNLILAVLATTEKIDLSLRFIKKKDDPDLMMPHLFCTYLHMEQVVNADNVIIYKKSPYNPLNGLMLVFKKNQPGTVSAYVRSPTQVLTLIHYIHDSIPYRVIVTTTKHKIVTTTEELSDYNEEISGSHQATINSINYASCILNQTSLIAEYLEKCALKINESKNPENIIDIGIDLFALGPENYLEFRNSILNESLNGIQCLINDDSDVEMENDAEKELEKCDLFINI